MTALFALTMFISAALMFSVQPMIAKMILPCFGGAPAVWNTCMVFFQAALLAGYGYVHLTTTGPKHRRQTVFHVALVFLALMAAPLLTLAFQPSTTWLPPGGANPIPWVLGLLTVSVGLPFFALAATAPLVQRWFVSTGHPDARDPYFLYGASNTGSMLALISYPLIIEPNFRLTQQMWLWLTGYAILFACIAICSLIALRRTQEILDASMKVEAEAANATVIAPHDRVPTWPKRLRWLALAFVPSSLMLGVTSYLSTDIAAIPLLWVLPLALYLLSFIIVFASRPIVSHATTGVIFPMIILGQTFVFSIHGLKPIWLLFALHLTTFFVVALACHGELAQNRPPTRYLTEFYLWLAAGGVAGGIFNSLLAPLWFETLLEYPLAIVAACFLVPSVRDKARLPTIDWHDVWLPIIFFLVLSTGIPLIKTHIDDVPLQVTLIFGLPAAICYSLRGRPLRFGLCVGAILLADSGLSRDSKGVLVYRERSFFGISHVVDVDLVEGKARKFVHGSTLHGMQKLSDKSDSRREPLTYYFKNGPIGDLFTGLAGNLSRARVAVLGLGVGTLASYGEAGQEWTFFEIDPVVERIAVQYFDYLQDCRGRHALVQVILGDGRLALAQAPEGRFDLIFADAFSSDAVPVHLLTREALALYRSKLNDHGVLVFNLTNRYLDLEPVAQALAADAGLCAILREERDSDLDESDKKNGKTPSRWMVMARRESDLKELANNSRWRKVSDSQAATVWTDDYSNILGALRW